MDIDLKGKIKEVERNLPAHRFLLPLCEAIVNSFQAIEDIGGSGGKVTISFTRDRAPLLPDDGESRALGVPKSFTITDNGVGFTAANYDSFKLAYSTYKEKVGGKGVGRFSWLAAFDEVVIDSTYEEGGKYYRRQFRFVPRGSGIEEDSFGEVDTKERCTIVRLSSFKPKYRDKCWKRLPVLAAHIVEQCIEYFVPTSCPRIILQDITDGSEVCLNDIYKNDIIVASKAHTEEIGGHEFRFVSVRLTPSYFREHLVHFCSNRYSTRTEKLAGRVTNLEEGYTPEDDDNKPFTYGLYVESEYLDEHANSQRTDFLIPDDTNSLLDQNAPVTWISLMDAATRVATEYLEPYLTSVQEIKERDVKTFIMQSAPQYRPILRQIQGRIGVLPVSTVHNSRKLEIELYRIARDMDVELKEEGQELFQGVRPKDYGDPKAYDEKFAEYFKKVTDSNMVQLASYVCHRKLVIEHLGTLLKWVREGEHHYEEEVHSLLFPMGKTSEEVQYERHNLWLLDERMVFHSYLASDRRMSSHEPVDSDSSKEPDLVVYDVPHAFGATSSGSYDAISIVEFKRPGRDNYTVSDNPVRQVYGYMDLILEGRARKQAGEALPVHSNAQFFCYIVCDLVPTLEAQLKQLAIFSKVSDGLGYHGHHSDYNAYIEIISYEKILQDSRMRNAVFFNKLGLPSGVHKD